MSVSDPPIPPAQKPRILPLSRVIVLLILAAAIGILFRLNQGGPTTVVVQAQPTPAASAQTVEPAAPAPVMLTPAAPATTPAFSAPQPVATPTTGPSVAPLATAVGTTVPATAGEVAARFGGSPDQWSKGPDEWGRTVGANGWIFRSHGTQQIHFVVSQGMVVDTSQGRFSAGAQIDTSACTVYWV